MLTHQRLKLDGDKVILQNTIDDDYAAKAAHERRQELNREGNARGWSDGRTMLHAGTIPAEAFTYDPMLREYVSLRAAGNREEASRVMKLFLKMNRQFRVSDANL